MWRRRRFRARDARALAFAILTIPTAFLASYVVLHSIVASAAAGGAYTVWLMSRGRMIRVMRRLRGERVSEWTGYYED